MVLINSLYFNMIVFIYFYTYSAHRDVHSFPARRSSDLLGPRRPRVRRLRRVAVPAPRAQRRGARRGRADRRSEEHTSELQSRRDLVCRLLLEKKENISYILIKRHYSFINISPTTLNLLL